MGCSVNMRSEVREDVGSLIIALVTLTLFGNLFSCGFKQAFQVKQMIRRKQYARMKAIKRLRRLH